jgi:hypothetical protein
MTRFSRFAVLSLLGFGPLMLGGCVESDGGGDDGGDTQGQGDDGADDGVADDGGDGGDDTGGDGGDDGPGPAAVGQCREVCDRLLTFDCLVADTHETCYATCPERSEDEIAQFTACVDGTLPGCEGCWENFLDAEPVPPADGDGDDDGGDGGDDSSVGEATCEDACEEWLGAGCPAFGEFDSCAGFCTSIPESAHDLVVECVENRDGCTLPESCTFEEGGSQGGG